MWISVAIWVAVVANMTLVTIGAVIWGSGGSFNGTLAWALLFSIVVLASLFVFDLWLRTDPTREENHCEKK